MSICTEIAIFKVSKKHIDRVVELSHLVVSEINLPNELICKYKVLVKNDDPEEICWHFEWKDEGAVKLISKTWSKLPSAKELESLVDEKIYYGHFLPIKTSTNG